MNDSRPSTPPRDPRVQAALEEYLESIDRGETVPRQEFLERYPDVADELSAFIATEDQLRQMVASGDASGKTIGEPTGDTRSNVEHDAETVPPRRAAGSVSNTGGRTELPSRFGRYRILKALGSGAMGVVYLAEDTQLERKIALKTPAFENDESGELLERFYREARSAATLQHPHICPVYDVGEIDSRHYIAMAYIEGRPLSAFIRPDKRLPERKTLMLVRKLAQALIAAHAKGIIHRDLKPSNVMVDTRGEPVIMDFGLAHDTQRADASRLTQSGMLIGSPAYMSPEQVEGVSATVTSASDQYSLGVILFELLTGGLPFNGSVTGVIAQILTREPPALSALRKDVDPRVEAACRRMMAKSPSDRFPTMEAVVDELTAILKGEPTETASAGSTSSSTSVSRSNVSVLVDLARDCMAKHDYEQVVQVLEQIPDKSRSDSVYVLLERAREKLEEIAYLVAELDEAVRMCDRELALRKAEELLEIKPSHHRAVEVKRELSPSGIAGWRIFGGGARRPRGRNEKPWGIFSRPKMLLAAIVGCVALGATWGIVSSQLDDDRADGGKQTGASGNAGSDSGATPTKPSDEVEARKSDRHEGLEFVSLFDGSTLEGWEGDREVWTVENGAIVGHWKRQTKGTYLYTAKKYDNFVLRAKFKLEYGNTGIMFRCTPHTIDRLTGYQADMTYDEFERAGDLYHQGGRGIIKSATQAQTDELSRAVNRDGWNDYEIVADGNHIVLTINGVTTVDTTDSAQADGVIGLQLWDGKTKVHFKEIRIRELRKGESPPARNWQSLFDGKSFDGWTFIGARKGWSIEDSGTQDARLVFNGAKESGWLATDREFGDFELKFDYKLEIGGNSGVLFRASRTGDPTGVRKLEIQLLDDAAPAHRDLISHQLNGALYGIIPVRKKIVTRANQWHTMQIRARGPEIRVTVDGVVVTEDTLEFYRQLADRVPAIDRRRGRIGLQRHRSRVEFRDIQIRELLSESKSGS